MIHDAVRGGEDDVAEVTRREEVVAPGGDILEGEVETGGDDAGLVQTADEVDHDLATAVVVNDLELANVA